MQKTSTLRNCNTKPTKRILMLLLCVVMALPVCFIPAGNVSADTDHFQFSTDFSSTQGQNQWYYMQWDGTSYSNMTWDSGNSRWQGAQAYCMLTATYAHPDTNDAVIAWKAPKDGTIRISFGVAAAAGGDGVNVKVLRGASSLWPSSGWQLITSGAPFVYQEINVTVARNDLIYFIVNKNVTRTSDTTNWDPAIVYTKDSYQFSTDFSSTQGLNQWYYMQWDGSSYSNMTWDSGNVRWHGAQTYCLVAGTYMHPDANDAVIAWKAPRDGIVRISSYMGAITNTTPGGDGVKVKVLKGASGIWPASGWQSISPGGSAAFAGETVTVSQNEMIYFILNKNVNTSYDTVNWDPIVVYMKDSYQFSTDFSVTQGQNQWYYMQWDGSSYSNMTWDSANSRWKGSQNYCLIASTYMHPDANDAVIAWKAPRDGTIRITSSGVIQNTTSGGDGVKVKVMKGASNIWPASGWQNVASGGYAEFPGQIITVSQNDVIYFILNKNANNSCDTTGWDPVIKYMPAAQPGIRPCFSDTYRFSSGFSGTQGQYQWYYKQWDGSNYSNMSWDSVAGRWVGSQAGCLVGNGWVSPDSNDTVIAWRAPKSGTVTIKGMIDHDSTLGDGVSCRIIKNSAQVWPSSGWQDIIPNLTVQHAFQVTVAQDDYIYFHLNRKNNNSNDLTFWDPIISYDDNPRFTLDKSEMAISKTQATNMGAIDFDASVSIIGNGTNFDFYNSSGGNQVQKFTGTLEQPAQTSIYDKDAFTNPNNIEGRWWITNIYKDVDGGLLAFCHLEQCPNNGFWALGLAYSNNGGNTFIKLGKILTHNVPDNGNVNIFGLPYIIKDGYFYVYYGENMIDGGFPAVCRAPVSEVLTAAKAGTVSAWKKYYNGAWNEDGLGGIASTMMPGSAVYDWATHGDSAYSSTIGRYMLACYTHRGGNGVWLAFSTDGVNYEYPEFILNSVNSKTLHNLCPYNTVINTDGSDNGVIGESFYVYWNQRTGFDATCNQLFRQKVTLNSEGFTEPSFDAGTDFNVDQGVRQWYYQESDGSTYSNMRNDSVNNRWMGIIDTQSLIGPDWQQPGSTTDSVRKWIAPMDGTITITANGGSVLVSDGTGADGVKVKVLKNTANIWPSSGWETIAAGGTAEFTQQTVTVTAGDAIYFIVNRNSNNSYDTTTWEPIIRYQ